MVRSQLELFSYLLALQTASLPTPNAFAEIHMSCGCQCSLEAHLVNSVFQILYLLPDFYQGILSIPKQDAAVAVVVVLFHA